MKKIILVAMSMIMVTALAAGLFIILRQAWAGTQVASQPCGSTKRFRLYQPAGDLATI
jgi:hypothetical protein